MREWIRPLFGAACRSIQQNFASFMGVDGSLPRLEDFAVCLHSEAHLLDEIYRIFL
jgi:hypothetical protein